MNGATLAFARIATKVATTIVMIVVARFLGDEQFGIFSSILTYVTFFGLIQEWGLTTPLIRRIARRDKKAGDLIGETISIKLLLSIPAFFGVIFVSWVVKVDPVIVAIFGCSMVLEVLNVSLTRGFEGIERMSIEAIILIIERSVLLVGSLLVLVCGGGLVALSFAYLVTNASSLILALVFWKRQQQPICLSFMWHQMRSNLREAFPFAIAALFSVVYNRVDILILGMDRGAAEVGWYTAAYRVADAQLFIPTALVASIFPVLSRSADTDLKSFKMLYGKSFYMLAGLGFSLALLTYFFSFDIIKVLFGSDYRNAAPALSVLSATIPFCFLNVLVGSSLIAIKKDGLSMATLGIGAALNSLLNFFMVPLYGQMGCSIAKVITEVVAFVVQLFFFHFSFPQKGAYTIWKRHEL